MVAQLYLKFESRTRPVKIWFHLCRIFLTVFQRRNRCSFSTNFCHFWS